MSAVADKLREAKALIERGWTQRRLRTRRGQLVSFCSVGALMEVGATRVAMPYLRQAIHAPQITAWNDAPERTQADVLAAFDRAIELAESGQ